MINLLVQATQAKFIQNTIYCKIPDTSIMGSVIANNLYKLYYSYKPTHIIFAESELSGEVLQFIEDFSYTVKCFIFHDQLSFTTIDNLINFPVIHITNAKSTNNLKNIIVYPKYIVNKQLFYNDPTKPKKDNIICFLDYQEILSAELASLLYPNTKLPIKLFNNSKIHSYQNLGLVDEKQKAIILQNHSYYLALPSMKNDYTIESILCGCTVVTLDNIHNYKDVPFNTLENQEIVDHATFIKESILI